MGYLQYPVNDFQVIRFFHSNPIYIIILPFTFSETSFLMGFCIKCKVKNEKNKS